MGDFAAVHDLLTARFGVGLEEVLCDGCLLGRLTVLLADLGKIVPRLLHSETEDDGGEYATYAGIFMLQDIWYRFRCHIFVDASGQRFLTDIEQFEAIEWQVRLAM